MKLLSMTLHVVHVPLVSPFTTSFMTETTKDCYLVEAVCEVDGRRVTGWGENVAMAVPFYSPEFLVGGIEVTRRWLAPMLFAAEDLSAENAAGHLRAVRGNPMAKAAVEMALLDAQLRARGQSFASYLGVTRTSVPSGVSVGIQEDVPATLRAIEGYLEQGYSRVKLKIKPGADLAPVAAVRAEFGDDLPFQVDANAAYTLADANHLRRLDEHHLLIIEQPLGDEDIRQHAELARLLATPVCLDESIHSAEAAADAIALRATSVINVKPGRVGGYLEARRIHDLCVAFGIGLWCGGMVELGFARAANAALAAMPGFTLPGDISGSDRFFAEDILVEPVTMHDGVVDVPTGPGWGVEVDRERLARFTSETVELRP